MSPISETQSRFGNAPYTGALAIGSCLGMVSAIAGIACLFAMRALLPKALWGPSAAASMTEFSNAGFFLLGVVCVPFIETFMGQLLPVEICRRIGLNRAMCVLASAIVFALGHFLNGGLAHGIAALVGGSVFAGAYVIVRAGGYLPSCLSAYTAHMTHNFLLFYVAARLFPELG